MKPFHILVVRFSSLGDVVLTSSVLSFLKKRWGNRIYLSYLTSAPFRPLVEFHKDVDKAYGFSRAKGLAGLSQLKALVKDIDQERKIDLLLDLHGTLRSLFIRLAFWKIPRLVVDKRTVERWILTGLKMDFLSDQGPRGRSPSLGEPLLHRNVRDWAPLFDEEFTPEKLSSYVTEGARDLGRGEQNQVSSCSLTYRSETLSPELWSQWGLPDLTGRSLVCVVPSASFPEKRWPASRFVELLRRSLSHPQFQYQTFLLLAGPTDDFCDLFNPLKEEFPGRFYNLQGKTSLWESTLLLKKSLLCVGNDTGLPHLAESVGTPSLFILGPTGEEFGFYPHLKNSRITSVSLWCRPCTTNGKGHCIRSERFCLTRISVEMVLEQMLQMKKELS